MTARTLGEKWHETSPLELQTPTTEVTTTLKAPGVDAACHIGNKINVPLDLDINLGPERGYELERAVEACFDVLVEVDDPGHGSVEICVMVIHHKDEEVALIPSRLLLVVRNDVL